MRKAILLLLSVLLLFSSCSGEDYASLYGQGEWQELANATAQALSRRIEAEALHYRLLALYRLEDYDGAVDAALLYAAMYTKDGQLDKGLEDALRILLYHSPDNSIRLEAARRLDSSSTSDQIAYFSALMAEGLYEEAAELYNSLRPSLSARTASWMCINSKASSTVICTNLEAWEAEEGRSAELRSAVLAAGRLMLSRGESALLLPTALSVYDGGDSVFAIMLGDIYAQMGDRSNASTYYSYAYSDYPETVVARLSALKAL